MSEQRKDFPIKVSVVVITYQQEKTLPKALDSVLAQQVSFPIEVLVGDDCSTDGTGRLLQEYQSDQRLKVIHHPYNLGASRNLYELIIRAKGDYISFLEGDDFWCDNQKLAKQVSFLDRKQEYVACTHLCRIVDEEGTLSEDHPPEWLFRGNIFTITDFRGLILPGHLSTLMCRRRVFEEIADISILFRANKMISDRTLTLLLVAQGPVFQLQEEMSCYCSHTMAEGSNVTALLYQQNPDRIRQDLRYTLLLEKYAKKTWNTDAGFIFHKRDLFVSACWENLRHPGKKSWALLKDLLASGESLAEYLAYLPVGVCKKLLRKLRRKRRKGP